MRELAMKVQDVEDMLYESWEGPVDWPYVQKALQIKKDYGLQCQRAAGTKVGNIKNHLLMGVLLACLEDNQVSLEVRRELDAILGPKYRTEGICTTAHKVHKLIGHLTVAQGKKATYMTIGVKGEEGRRMYALLRQGITILGKEQEDPPIATPVFKDLKMAERAARAALKGRGKGKGA